MNDQSAQLTEAYSECQERLRDSYIQAQSDAAETAQQYSTELLAAGGGDDALERMRRAWLRLQHDMAKVHHDYASAVREQQRAWASVVQDVQAEAAEAAYEDYMEALRAIGLPPEGGAPTAPKPRKPSAPSGRSRGATTKQPGGSE